MSEPRPAVEALCELMHDAYERAAAKRGWQTQERSRKPWAEVPAANKATMREAVAALTAAVREQVAQEIEANVMWPPHGDECGPCVRAEAARIARGKI